MEGPERTHVSIPKLSRGAAGRGFTLVELLVSLAIIALIVALLLPAVQSAREAARMAGCKNNLRQLGIAEAAYHSQHGMFTPNYLLTDPRGSSNRTSCLVFLLPHLEQVALFNSFNTDFVRYDRPEAPLVENGTARRTSVAAFLCPSDGESVHRNNYRFNYGCHPAVGRVSDGPFSIGILPSAASVTDGLSRTAFVSERIGGSFVIHREDLVRDLKRVGLPLPNGNDFEAYPDYCESYPDPYWVVSEGRYWTFNGMEDGEYNHYGRPNDPRTSCGGPNYGLHPPRSFHPGGVNVLFGDSHVEFVPDAIDPKLWRALGTHADGD